MSKKAKTAITPSREEDFSEWYQQVIKEADMAENSPSAGCMIIKPYGYALWENMQKIFDGMIKDLGVQNAYFPLLIPLSFISREAEHVEGFAKECAVVTHHRLEAASDGNGLVPAAPLEEPYVVRPTSETIIGDAMSRWIQSYRDLPLKLNQWCSVLRWEMRPRMFLRPREFLWQEGHNAFESLEGAQDDALKMLKAYADFAENALAIPMIMGEKTPEERFPGADATYTIEAMMQDSKALQCGTSHNLGQNFSRSCGITFQGRSGKEEYAYTTSWGISIRLIGAMIMTHGDDDGMIMPPRVAPHQVGIIPIIREDADAQKVLDYARALAAGLKEQGIRAYLDESDERTPNKMWSMIKKGVPLRVEIGAREVEEASLTYTRRDLGRESKTSCSVEEFVSAAPGILDSIHDELFNRAKAFRDARLHDVEDLGALEAFFKEGREGFVRVDLAQIENNSAYERLKKDYALTSRCMPLNEPGKVIVGKAY